ncbi:unnamed protein product [Chrysoparadoxa australica]
MVRIDVCYYCSGPVYPGHGIQFVRNDSKEMAVDTTFDFEKRRNRPVKYDRELMGKTLMAMKKVQEVKGAREARFHQLRHKDAKSKEKAAIKAEIQQNIELMVPAAADREKAMANIREKVKKREKSTAARAKAREMGS